MNKTRDQFPIFTNKQNLVYLDSASSTQKPEFVIQKTNEYITHSYSNLWRGSYKLTEESDYFYYECKEKIATLIGCKSNEIFFSHNATYCINTFANAIAESGHLSEWKKIILSIIEHHANILIRQKLASEYNCDIIRLWLNQDLDLDLEELQSMDHTTTAVISLSLCSNVLWIKNNLSKIRNIVGDSCIFCIDASQAIPNYQINVTELWCDFTFFSAHKFLAYTWLGIGFIKKWLQKKLKAQILGGGIIEEVSHSNYLLKTSVEQFEAWTPNIISIVSLNYAIDRWNHYWWYIEREKQEKTLMDHIDKEFIKRESDYKVLNIHKKSIWIRIFTSTKFDNQKINNELSKNNICIRAGWHCTHPLHNYLWMPNGSIRLSLYVYNTIQDIDLFFKTLDSIHH
jgi:cysteine desulfurase/selenocysteine lyase